jgi:hypothetical protein
MRIGLRLRGDTELRVHGHLAARVLVDPSGGVLVHGFPVAQYQRHDAADAALVDEGLE